MTSTRWNSASPRPATPAPCSCAGAEAEALASDGGLLGIFPDETFQTRTVQLRPGDRLTIFTDGVEVAFADDGRSPEARWREELTRRRDLPADQLLADFASRLDGESGSLDPRDDLTMMVIDVAQ